MCHMSVYSRDGGGLGVVYKRLCDPSHLNQMHLLLPFRLGQVLQSQP